MTTVEKNVVQSIDAATVESSPFPHLNIDGIFPPDFYTEIQHHIPDRSLYQRMPEAGDVSDGAHDTRITFHLARLDVLPVAQRPFWRDLASWMISSNLASAFAKKFAKTIEQNAKRDPHTLEYGVEAILVKYPNGYRDHPHTGAPSCAVNAMFYLPSNDKRQFSTALYEPNGSSLHLDPGDDLNFNAFNKSKAIPSRPNSLFAFARSDRSFHGIESIPDMDFEYNALLYLLHWR